MNILAVDTAGKTAGVALLQDDRLLYEVYLDAGMTHSETLMPMIDTCLKMCGMTCADIDLYGVNAGPGSFTGLRIGLAAVKGLAFPRETLCAPVSTLEALAAAHTGEGTVLCALDARRAQVYSAAFDLATHARLLDEFGKGRAQVLIGTQMIAKGLDFPKVTLVGVVAADMTLNLPDYRSAERTFQLITQVAGRAGRAQEPGEVIVQSYKPDDPCIQAAAKQDYRAFFEMEFSRRRAGLYPPFTMLCRLLVESPDEAEAKDTSERLYDTLQTYLLSHPVQKKKTLMIRADEAPVKRIRGQYRYHVLLKLFDQPETAPLLRLMSELTATGTERCHIYVEVNPATMM